MTVDPKVLAASKPMLDALRVVCATKDDEFLLGHIYGMSVGVVLIQLLKALPVEARRMWHEAAMNSPLFKEE